MCVAEITAVIGSQHVIHTTTLNSYFAHYFLSRRLLIRVLLNHFLYLCLFIFFLLFFKTLLQSMPPPSATDSTLPTVTILGVQVEPLYSVVAWKNPEKDIWRGITGKEQVWLILSSRQEAGNWLLIKKCVRCGLDIEIAASRWLEVWTTVFAERQIKPLSSKRGRKKYPQRAPP